jgi:hypothetical protein
LFAILGSTLITREVIWLTAGAASTPTAKPAFFPKIASRSSMR